MRRRWQRWLAAGAASAVLVAGAAVVLDRLFPPDLSRLERLSTEVVAEDGTTLRLFTAADGRWRLPVDMARVDPLLVEMLVAREDKRFFWHIGVDPLALGRAVWQAVTHGDIVSGASTLTMQTARLLEPRERNVGAKLTEIARALQLEWRFDKQEILAMYLTLAPYGGNIEGVRAASLFYLGREPQALTDAEAALLVALPQSPERLRPDRDPDAAVSARNRVLEIAAEEGVLTEQAAIEAATASVPSQRRSAPLSAAHLAERLHRADPGAERIETSVDADLQRGLERLVALAAGQWPDDVSVAVLAIENDTGAVRAYVGSADYLDQSRYGPIDMVTAVRSPGSTLKPFLYAMAFDARLLHPETLVLDRPTRFGDYVPENFDGGFRGEITAGEALRSSLNVPAVAILSRVGPGPFLDRLESAGMHIALPKADVKPGLAVILGGVGTSLEDLVTLYSGLARGGNVVPLQFGPVSESGTARTFVSPLGAFYTTRILESVPAPPERLAGTLRSDAPIIAYKTGTSYGYRDAWAIGYDSRYTIGVWVGRPDGSFSNGRMGRDTAAPLLFDAFDLLPPDESRLVRALPSGPAPAGAILARSTAELPLPLQRFGSANSVATNDTKPGPTIEFPLDGGRIALDANGNLAPLALDASGGSLPLLWLVNGETVPSQAWKRHASWQPDGPGQARITVIDGDGRHASVDIWIE